VGRRQSDHFSHTIVGEAWHDDELRACDVEECEAYEKEVRTTVHVEWWRDGYAASTWECEACGTAHTDTYQGHC